METVSKSLYCNSSAVIWFLISCKVSLFKTKISINYANGKRPIQLELDSPFYKHCVCITGTFLKLNVILLKTCIHWRARD